MMGPSVAAVAAADVDVAVVVGPFGDGSCGFGDSVCFGEGASVPDADDEVDVVVALLGEGPFGFGDSVCFADWADGGTPGVLVDSLFVFVVVTTVGWGWPE